MWQVGVFTCALFVSVRCFFVSADIASKNHKNNNASKNLNTEHNIKNKNKLPVSEKNKDGKIKIIVYSHNDENNKGSTVFSELISYGKKNNIEIKYNNNYKYGVFIESIGGVQNGAEGRYWQYYVNGILGSVAADKKSLKKGDMIEWRFEKALF